MVDRWFGGGTDLTPYYLFDLELRQNLSSNSALKLPEYLYGGLGFRGNGEWNGEGKTNFLTSEGKDRTNGQATTSNWVHISGKVNEEITGKSRKIFGLCQTYH